jgi:hypothetical protein
MSARVFATLPRAGRCTRYVVPILVALAACDSPTNPRAIAPTASLQTAPPPTSSTMSDTNSGATAISSNGFLAEQAGMLTSISEPTSPNSPLSPTFPADGAHADLVHDHRAGDAFGDGPPAPSISPHADMAVVAVVGVNVWAGAPYGDNVSDILLWTASARSALEPTPSLLNYIAAFSANDLAVGTLANDRPDGGIMVGAADALPIVLANNYYHPEERWTPD